MRPQYICSHCDGYYGRFDTPEACEAHEAKCSYNPANRTCSTCRHFDFQSGPEHEHWKPPGTGTYEHEDDIPQPMGCHVYNDQEFRWHCEKWKGKK